MNKKIIIIGLLIIAIVSGCNEKYNDKKFINDAGNSYTILSIDESAELKLRLDDINLFENNLHVSGCTKQIDKHFENNTIKFICDRSDVYSLQLLYYKQFKPCTPCPTGAKDCACSCKTDFKRGLAWKVSRIGIMSLTRFYDVENGNMFCSVWGA